MEHLEDHFNGVNNIKLYYQVWRPEGNPKAIVQIIHGIAEHSGRYLNVVNELVPKGYIIYASDLRGHGKSGELKAFVKKFEDFVEDQRIFFNLIKEKEKELNLPIFLLGHSMGHLIAKIYATKYPEGLKGLILSGAGTTAGGSTGAFLKAMAKLISALAPKSKIDPKIDPESISRDPEVVKAYVGDPLVFKKITVRLGAELLKGFKSSNKLTSKIKLPTLIQSGSADKLVLGVKELEKIMTMPDKIVKIYDGLRHEVYNELEADRKIVLNDLANWLDNHL